MLSNQLPLDFLVTLEQDTALNNKRSVSEKRSLTSLSQETRSVKRRPKPDIFSQDKDKIWAQLLASSIETPEELHRMWGENLDAMKQLQHEFKIRINPYYASLIKEKDDPIYKQVVPSLKELTKGCCVDDPLSEEKDSPIPNITHRYKDRVLFLVAHECAVYCRFCTRKRKVSDPAKISLKYIEDGIQYIREHSEIRDVILSGGDPLLLSDRRLDYILKSLRDIPHIEIIRIGTKIPCVLPQRITRKLCNVLKKYHPLYINTHFNHPNELTPEAKKACDMLADTGVPLGNQTVLLKGVNDDPEVMRQLMKGLLKMRVRPYYIYQADPVTGTEHFRTKVEKGLEIMKALRGHMSGLGVPHFVIDAPGGGGKIPLLPHYIDKVDGEQVIMKNYIGQTYIYPQVKDNIDGQEPDKNGFAFGAEIQDYIDL